MFVEMIIARKRRQDGSKTGPDPGGNHDAFYHCEKQRFLWRHTREIFEFAQKQQISESPVTFDSTFDMPEGGVPSPMNNTDRISRLFRDYCIFMRIMMKMSLGK